MPETLGIALSQLPVARQTLLSYRNDDGGWGEHRTQASRLTNTSEALWALASLGISSAESAPSVRFLLRAIGGTNPEPRQNCERARDYAWTLIALSSSPCPSELEAEKETAANTCLDRLDALQRSSDGAYALWLGNQEPSSFTTALVLLAFIERHSAVTSQGIDPSSALSAKTHRVASALSSLRNSDDGWGPTGGAPSTAAYTAYAFASLARYQQVLQPTGQRISLTSSADYLRSSDLAVITQETPRAADVRPYRHFTAAWALLGYGWSDLAATDQGLGLARRLTTQYVHGGWSAFNPEGDDVPLTWATALAAKALTVLFARLDLTDVLKHVEPIDLAAPAALRFRLNAVRRENPRRFHLLVILLPLGLIAATLTLWALLVGASTTALLTLGFGLAAIYLAAAGAIYTMYSVVD